MVRLNKNQLTDDQLDKLITQLSKTVGRLSEKQTDVFLNALLGPEERIMLAKRLAIIVLLLEKRTLYSVASLLKVSPSTASKIKKELDNGVLDDVVLFLKNDKVSYLEIISLVDNILHLNGLLPHYSGKSRLRRL